MSSFSAALCVGQDPLLLNLRCRVLATRFFIINCSTVPEMKHALADRQYDLLVLCHSLSAQEIAAAIQLFRARYPDAAVIALSTTGDEENVTGVDAHILSLAGPVALFAAIDRVMLNGRPRFQLLRTPPSKLSRGPQGLHPNLQEYSNGQVQHLG